MSQLRVLVTGGGRGIGRAIALRFAREGAKIVVAARTSTELDDVVKEIEALGGQGLAAQMNIGDWGSVEAAIYRATNYLADEIDVLVNCAGIFEIAPFEKMSTEIWQRALDVNLSGAFYVTMEALDAVESGTRPHIFNVASVAARQGFPGNTAYCASKYGLRGFGDALRLDLADSGIRVTTVYPGPTDTTVWDKVEGDWDRSKMNSPDDVAEAIFQAYSSEEDPSELIDLEIPAPA